MDMQNLIHMANQIGSFFEAMSDREEALVGISGHLHNYWEPRMRSQLLGYVDMEDGKELKPIVLAAIRAHREKLISKK